MEINEIAEKSAATTFLEGYMIDDGNAQTVDYDAWRTSVEGDEDICRLAVGAIIVSEMREAVLKETQFTCSAGIAHNKVRIQNFLWEWDLEKVCYYLATFCQPDRKLSLR